MPNTTLGNGLEVCLRPIHGGNRATILLLFKGGSAMDPPEVSDGVHLLEHLFLNVGSKTRDPVSPKQRWGGPQWKDLRLSGRTWPDHMMVCWTCPPERLHEELAEVALRLQGLLIDPATWEQERKDVLEQIRERLGMDGVRWAAARGLPAGPGDPSPWAERREEGFARLTMDEVRRLDVALLRPDRAILSVVGRFDPRPVEQRIHETFGAIRRPIDPPRAHASERYHYRKEGLHTAVRPREEGVPPRLLISFQAPDPWHSDFPAFLVAAERLWRRGKTAKGWPLDWTYPERAEDIVLTVKVPWGPVKWAWEEALADLTQVLREPLDLQELGGAQDYARRFLGIDDRFAARDVRDLETAAYMEAYSRWKGLDREAMVEAVGRVTPEDLARTVRRWLSSNRASGYATVPPLPTEWIELTNGIRLGVHPLPEAEKAAVAFLLPFGRENGPSPVVARLFAHGLTPGWGVSPWSVRSGRDATVLWWVGAPRSIDWILRDLAARLAGTTPTEPDLEAERARADEPDPFPYFGFPPGASTALREGARVLEGRAGMERPAPVDAREAAHQLAGWCTLRSARVVVAGSVDAPSVRNLLERTFSPLRVAGPPPPLADPVPVPDPPYAAAGTGDRICRAFAFPPTAATDQFAACLLVGLRHGVPYSRPLSGTSLPPVVFDPLMEPGVFVFISPPGRSPPDPGSHFLGVEGDPSQGERWLLELLVGETFGMVQEVSPRYSPRSSAFPAAAAIGASLLDFRQIDGAAIRRAIHKVTPETYAELVQKLQQATPAEYRLPAR